MEMKKTLEKCKLFFEDYISKAIKSLKIIEDNAVGRPEKLTLEQKVRILLIQRLIGKSNREMNCHRMRMALQKGIFL